MENASPKSSLPHKIAVFIKRNKKVLLILLAILLAGVVLYGTYHSGYNKGYTEGKKHASSTSSLENLLKNPTMPFHTVTGEIKSVSGNSVTINTSKGEVKTIPLNDNTKITQKTTTLKTSDLKAGQKVTVFTNGDDKNVTATRIVLRAQQ